jgi:hypothetical protein
MLDFTRLPCTIAVAALSKRRPRLLMIARACTRRFINMDKIMCGVEKVEFEVVLGGS